MKMQNRYTVVPIIALLCSIAFIACLSGYSVPAFPAILIGGLAGGATHMMINAIAVSFTENVEKRRRLDDPFNN